jgi:hypothetical protein
MILWQEYKRIKEQGKDWTDEDTRILLNFCWELQMAQHNLGEELKKSLKELDSLRKRIEFYRKLYPITGVK